jgi:mannose-6-phosphate isomerase-like protein (cupin superfamily)
MQFVKRKWGFYWTVFDQKNFKVKFLWFKKNHRCSYQYHNQRNELWLFLKGEGNFCKDEVFFRVDKGQFVKVMKQVKHQFEAIKRTLVLEIQYGEKCDEGDIVRV